MSKVVKVKNVEIGIGKAKVCALIIGENEKNVLELVTQANELECDLIEFRADYFSKITDMEAAKTLLGKMRKLSKKPIIFTFRTKTEGGNMIITQSYYKQLLRTVSTCFYADLIDVEENIAQEDADFIEELKDNGSYVIISKHDFQRTPTQEEIIQEIFKIQEMGADIVKVAYMPNNKKDVINLMSAVENITGTYATCPIVAISMGHLGIITRVFCEFMGSAISFGAISRAGAPGQMDVQEMYHVMELVHNNFKKIFLVGFMGTGKTTVANALQNNYGLSRMDLDTYIEQKEHMSIADIFESESEEGFRAKETKYLRQLMNKNLQVISLGGGTVMKDENVEIIKEKGIIVLLSASPETIQERVKNDRTRPILGDNFDLDYIRDLMKQREDKYQQVADVVINTDNKTIEEISKEIVETLGFTL